MSNLLLLRGHYQVVRPLGEGGLAKTYIAKDLDRPGHPQCVVKLLKPASKDSEFLPTARRLFNKEAEILEKLGRHARIPRLLAYFEENKEFYIIQEFIEGHSLDREMPSGRRWTESKVILMLQDVLKTLEFVHHYQVIHRDIKPSNLIRRRLDGALVLIDFGAVKQIGDRVITNYESPTKKTISIGTQGYIPTEQLKGKPRLNSDIYALGMTAIQALTGLDPLYLAEDDEGEVIWRNRAEVGEELAEILTKMIRDRFKDRYQSATEVLQDLDVLANDYPLVQEALVTKQQHSEIVFEPKLNETKISLDIEKVDRNSVSEVELRETKIVQDLQLSQPALKETNKKVTSKPNLGETKISLDRENFKSYKLQQKKLKIPLENEPLTIDEIELRETKISLETKQTISDLTSESEPRSTKVSVDIENSNVKNVFDRESNKSQLEQPTAISVIDRQLKINLASLRNLASIELPKFPLQNKFQLLIGLGVISVIVSIIVENSYLESRKYYAQAKQNLSNIKVLKTNKKYRECIQQAQIFPQDYSAFNVEVENLLNQCQQSQAKEQLIEAKALAEKSKFKDAIFLASQISKDTDAHLESLQLISKWSEKIWQIANNKYQEGKLEEAIAISIAIPTSSPLANKIANTIQQWQKDWQQNKAYIEEAQKGLNNYRWQDAINAAKRVKNNQYWQKESDKIIQKAQAEIAAAQYALSQKKYQSRSTYSSTIVKPRTNNLKSLYIDPNHPINDPNRDWVKERLGRE